MTVVGKAGCWSMVTLTGARAFPKASFGSKGSRMPSPPPGPSSGWAVKLCPVMVPVSLLLPLCCGTFAAGPRNKFLAMSRWRFYHERHEDGAEGGEHGDSPLVARQPRQDGGDG